MRRRGRRKNATRTLSWPDLNAALCRDPTAPLAIASTSLIGELRNSPTKYTGRRDDVDFLLKIRAAFHGIPG
jgi:hypothetical protein